jgi:hypothetical protein
MHGRLIGRLKKKKRPAPFGPAVRDRIGQDVLMDDESREMIKEWEQ